MSHQGSDNAVTVYTISGKRAGTVRPDHNGCVDAASVNRRFGAGLYMVKVER